MIDPNNIQLSDLLQFIIYVPVIVLVMQLVKQGLPHLNDWPYLPWAVCLLAVLGEVLIAFVVGVILVPADVGTQALRGLFAGLAACGLYDATGGVRTRVAERAAARNAAAYRE